MVRARRLVLVSSIVVCAAAGARAEQPAKPKPPPPGPAIPPEIAQRLPAGGFLIAHVTDHGDDDALTITRIDRSGAATLLQERTPPDEMAWLDGHTLVTITTDVDSDVTTVRRYVDGQPDRAPVTVAAGAWALPKGKTILDTRSPELWLGKGGAIWLGRCHTTRMRGRFDVCTGTAWLRVDGGGVTTAKKPPAGTKRAAPVLPSIERGGKLPKGIKPPAGYQVELRKVTVSDGDATDTVKGLVCSGPGGLTSTWPTAAVMDWQYDVRPSKVTWLSATPPLYAISGKATNPIGEVTSESRLFRACDPLAIDDAIWLGDGRRLEMKLLWKDDQYVGTAWTLFVDDVAIASIDGASNRVQVAPPP